MKQTTMRTRSPEEGLPLFEARHNHPDSRPDPQEAADRREEAADMRRDARAEDAPRMGTGKGMVRE